MSTIDPDLVRLLKRLKLGPLLPKLPERLALARAQQLDYVAFLTLLLADLGQARADRTYDKVFRRYLAPDLVILDDFGLRRLNAQQSNDLYELIVERHRRASFCITSNRSVDEWLALFDEPKWS